MLLLTEDDVRQLLTMEMALEAVEEGLRQQAREQAHNVSRGRCQTERVMLHLMGGSLRNPGAVGYKAYTTSREGARFHVGLFDGTTGVPLALMQADWLGQMRTGAASGVASKFMAGPDCESVGIYGSGKQARTQLMAICKVLPIRRIRAFSPNEARRKAFAAEMSDVCHCHVEPVARPEQAAHDMDIVVTATTSRQPVLHGNWLAEGTHLNVVGSNFLHKAEIDMDTIRRCRNIVVDSKEQARLEAGDLVHALEEVSLRWTEVHELNQVVVGKYPGRHHSEDITLFKSIGIGLEDVAVASCVYAKAKQMGVGKEVDF
ncbi:MAG: ornithine cyclodeaminase family protein [Gemmataceae bacterium]